MQQTLKKFIEISEVVRPEEGIYDETANTTQIKPGEWDTNVLIRHEDEILRDKVSTKKENVDKTANETNNQVANITQIPQQIGEGGQEGTHEIVENGMFESKNDTYSSIQKDSSQKQNLVDHNVRARNFDPKDDGKEESLEWLQIVERGKDVISQILDEKNHQNVSGLHQTEQSGVRAFSNIQATGEGERRQSCNTERMNDSEDLRDQSNKTCQHLSTIIAAYPNSNVDIIECDSSTDTSMYSNYNLVDKYSVDEVIDPSDPSTVPTYIQNKEISKVIMLETEGLPTGFMSVPQHNSLENKYSVGEEMDPSDHSTVPTFIENQEVSKVNLVGRGGLTTGSMSVPKHNPLEEGSREAEIRTEM